MLPSAFPPKRRRLYEIAGGALVLLLIVLFATGVLDIGGGGSSSETNSGRTTAQSETAAGSKRLTQAVLKPTDGGDASGRALFGRIKKAVVLQVVARGLVASPPGESYTVWLYRSPRLVLRVGAVKVTKSGGIAAQFPLPTELLAAVANGAFDQIDVSLTSDAAYQAEVAKAKKQKRLPAYTGESVLRGPIAGPLIR